MQPSLEIKLNGKPRQVRAGANLADLIEELGLSAAAVAVERNLKLVRSREHTAILLEDGDAIEVVTLVGGG